ncbi:unnamed protein product [Caenorhabditis brenneri]
MDSKPLGYDSLRILLQYLDANERFYLAHRAPSLQKIEKTIPLKIHYLSFGYDSFIINKTEYQFDYSQGGPHYIKCSNATFFPGLGKNGFEEFWSTMIPKVLIVRRHQPRFICIKNISIEEDSAPKSRNIHHQNFDRLVKILFSERRYPISVETFSVDERNIFQVQNGLKFKIHKLLTNGNPAILCNQLNPIIDPSCLPLEGVYVKNYPDRISIEFFQHQLIREAKRLFIGQYSRGDDPLPVFLHLKNMFIEKDGDDQLFDEYNDVINFWVHNGRPIGSTFIFHCYIKQTALDVMDQVEEDHNGAVRGNECITVPMPSFFSQLRVSCKPKKNRNTPDDWVLELKIVPLNDQIVH